MSGIGVSVLLVALDQAVKFRIASSMRLGHSIPVLEGIFHITYIENPGAAFGLFANQRWMFLGAGAALLLFAAVFYRRIRRSDCWTRYGAALLLGGAVGNLIDRVRLGQVIDFLDFRIWPVFNIADIGICVGVGCILFALLREKSDEGSE